MTAAVSAHRRRSPGRGPACRPDRRGGGSRRPGTAGPARRSAPVGRGRAWRTAGARAMCAARCVPAVSADAAWPAAMRPTPAASTLSEFRWRRWAVCRRWVAPVCAGTARAWRTPDDGLLGAPFGLFRIGPFPLAPFLCPFPALWPLSEAFGYRAAASWMPR